MFISDRFYGENAIVSNIAKWSVYGSKIARRLRRGGSRNQGQNRKPADGLGQFFRVVTYG